MPDVDTPAKLGDVFVRARKAAADDTMPGKPGKNRHVGIVTPGRMVMMHPCPAPGTMKPELAQEVEKS